MCYLCGEAGHFQKDCPKNVHQNLSKSKHKGKSACLISEADSYSDSESDEKVLEYHPNLAIQMFGWLTQEPQVT